MARVRIVALTHMHPLWERRGVALPLSQAFRDPVLNALRTRGGEATNSDIRDAVAAELSLTAEDLAVLHNPQNGKRTEVEYRLAWARTRLKNDGLIERVQPQVWRLTESPPSRNQ